MVKTLHLLDNFLNIFYLSKYSKSTLNIFKNSNTNYQGTKELGRQIWKSYCNQRPFSFLEIYNSRYTWYMFGDGRRRHIHTCWCVFINRDKRIIVNVKLLSLSLWGKMPDLQKQKIEKMSIFLASWMYLMVLIDISSFFMIKHCTFNA